RDVSVDLDLDLRMLPAIFEEEPRQEVERRAFVGADRQLSTVHRSQLADGAQRFLPHIEHPLGVGEEYHPSFRESPRTIAAIEERFPKLLLEPLEGNTDRRLSPEHLLSSPRKTLLFGNFGENLQL